jgi:hypothetical protein
MKMLLKTADVVSVRMGVEKGVDEQPALVVPIELLTKLFSHVGRSVVLVVGGLTDIDVAEDTAA